MVSAKCCLVFVSFGCLMAVMVAMSSAKNTNGGPLDLGSKCTPKLTTIFQQIELIKECIEERTGKAFNPLGAKSLSAQDKKSMDVCVARKMGIINVDGTLNVGAAKHALKDDINTSPKVKAGIEAGIEKCGSKGGDPSTIMACLETSLKRNCGGGND